MDEALNLCQSTQAQDKLKCSFCDKFLSVAPIYSNDVATICGRCKFVDRGEDASKWSRQNIFEQLAQHMTFPCSNSPYGCRVNLRFNDVEEHESSCMFKKVYCPLCIEDFSNAPKCTWCGSGSQLNEHIETCHADLIKKLPELEFKTEPSNERTNRVMFSRLHKQLVIVTLKFEPPATYYCLVMVNGTSTNVEHYRYQLELYDPLKGNIVILRKNRVEDSLGMAENLTNFDKTIIIRLPVITEHLKNPQVIHGRFGIIKKSKKEIHNLLGSNNANPWENHVDENFLRELECPICKNYLISPIYICEAGHSLCHRCKAQINQCPTCREPFHDTRNFNLERLVACVNFPCVNRDAGCCVMVSSDKLREHEKDCSYSGSTCFYTGCASPISLTNMFVHLNTVHKKSIIQSGDVQIFELNEYDTDIDVEQRICAICFGNDMFRLVVEYRHFTSMRFSLQQFGVTESNYLYEVEIIYSQSTTQTLTILSNCKALNLDEGGAWDDCIDIPFEMLQKYISEDDLVFFKVHLKKASN